MKLIIKVDTKGIIKSYVQPIDESCESVIFLFKGYTIENVKDDAEIVIGKTLLSDILDSSTSDS